MPGASFGRNQVRDGRQREIRCCHYNACRRHLRGKANPRCLEPDYSWLLPRTEVLSLVRRGEVEAKLETFEFGGRKISKSSVLTFIEASWMHPSKPSSLELAKFRKPRNSITTAPSFSKMQLAFLTPWSSLVPRLSLSWLGLALTWIIHANLPSSTRIKIQKYWTSPWKNDRGRPEIDWTPLNWYDTLDLEFVGVLLNSAIGRLPAPRSLESRMRCFLNKRLEFLNRSWSLARPEGKRRNSQSWRGSGRT